MVSCLSDFDHGFLLQARVRLALNQPFLATAITRLPFKEAGQFNWCETMATDGYHIYFNAGWARNLPKGELEAVIVHEVLHVVLGHADRINDRNKEVWNVACDYAINIMLSDLGFELPCGGLLEQRFRRMTAEQIYRELRPDTSKPYPQMLELAGDRQSPGGHLSGDVIDRDLLVDALPERSDNLDVQERRMLRRELIEGLESQIKSMGYKGGNLAIEVRAALQNKTDWALVLRRYLYEKVKTDWSMYPPSKKYIWQQIYLPSVGVSSLGTIVFAIDTSGSMSSDELSKALSEVRAIRSLFPCELIVMQCDASIQSVETYSEFDDTPLASSFTMKGFGGTDFRPVFSYVESKSIVPSVLIYATDGYGTFPETLPDHPVIWLLTDRGPHQFDPPFGVYIDLEI